MGILSWGLAALPNACPSDTPISNHAVPVLAVPLLCAVNFYDLLRWPPNLGFYLGWRALLQLSKWFPTGTTPASLLAVLWLCCNLRRQICIPWWKSISLPVPADGTASSFCSSVEQAKIIPVFTLLNRLGAGAKRLPAPKASFLKEGKNWWQWHVETPK